MKTPILFWSSLISEEAASLEGPDVDTGRVKNVPSEFENSFRELHTCGSSIEGVPVRNIKERGRHVFDWAIAMRDKLRQNFELHVLFELSFASLKKITTSKHPQKTLP